MKYWVKLKEHLVRRIFLYYMLVVLNYLGYDWNTDKFWYVAVSSIILNYYLVIVPRKESQNV